MGLLPRVLEEVGEGRQARHGLRMPSPLGQQCANSDKWHPDSCIREHACHLSIHLPDTGQPLVLKHTQAGPREMEHF